MKALFPCHDSSWLCIFIPTPHPAEELMLLNCDVGEDSVPWTERRSNQSILKDVNSEYSLEGLMLMLKLQYFGHLM